MEESKFKTHVRKHAATYIVVGVCVGVVIGRGYSPKLNVPITNAPVFNNTNTNTLGGYTSKLVKCLDTGQIWETVKDAAEAMGASPSAMSKHLNGHKDSINGMQFAIIGLGTSNL